MNKIKFGIIGCGGISSRMAAALCCSYEAEVYACAARDYGRAAVFASKYGAKRAYGSYRELIADPEVEAVYIGLVHTEHYGRIRECLEAGKPVLCEKPMFISSSEAKEMIALARKKNVLLMEAMWTRTLPVSLKIREWIRDGRIGSVKTMHADFCFSFPYTDSTRTFRLWDPAVAGGALWDAGVYPYEYFTFMAGEYPDAVQGMLLMEHDVDSVVSMQLHFPSGIVASGRAGFYPADQTVEISGDKGMIRAASFWNARHGELIVNGETAETCDDPVEEGFLHEISHFTGLMRAGLTESPLITLEDSLDFTAHAEKIFEDAKK